MMIRIYVGCAANWEDAESQAVLEYTLRKNASQPVKIVWMRLSRDPASPFYSDPDKGRGWDTSGWPTPFSGFRWIVPALAEFHGRAIYMDSDMICMDDIAKLWEEPFFPAKFVQAKARGRLCVSMWDCARFERLAVPIEQLMRIRDNHQHMSRVMGQNHHGVQEFRENWNCLDGEEFADICDPAIKMIHYTSMSHQPHLPHAIERLRKFNRGHWFDGKVRKHWRDDLIALFDEKLAEAKAAGYVPENYHTGAMYGDYRKATVHRQGERVPHWAGRYAKTG